MIKIDLLSIKTKDQADEFLKDVLNSNENEILKYINYLRYQIMNSDDIQFLKKISNFLRFPEITNIELNHPEIDFGDVEYLEFDNTIDDEIFNDDDFFINGEKYRCLVQLYDNYETVYITKKDDNYIMFGSVQKDNHTRYIYELGVETDEYYDKIINSIIGTKVNLLSFNYGEEYLRKTFIKDSINVDFNFIKVIKTDKGIYSNNIGGVVLQIQPPEVLLEVIEKTPETQPPDSPFNIEIQGGSGIGMISGDQFSDMIDSAGGIANLGKKLQADSFADMILDNVEDVETESNIDKEKLKKMLSDSIRLSEDEYAEKWKEEMKTNEKDVESSDKLDYDYVCILEKEINEIDYILSISTKEDFTQGFVESQNLPQKLIDILKINNIFELAPGIFEVNTEVNTNVNDFLMNDKEINLIKVDKDDNDDNTYFYIKLKSNIDDIDKFEVIGEYKNEDVIINGLYSAGESPTLSITDDEIGYNLTVNGEIPSNISYSNSAGFLQITSIEDFIDVNDEEIDDDVFKWFNVYLIKNFTGKILLKIRDCDGNYINSEDNDEDFLLWDENSDYIDIDLVTENDIDKPNIINIDYEKYLDLKENERNR